MTDESNLLPESMMFYFSDIFAMAVRLLHP